MRYCKTFFCKELGERVCCSSCHFRRDCSDPCLNHPCRCGLENTDKREKQTPHQSAAPTASPQGEA